MANTNLPNPQSLDQILGDMLSSYMSRTGINDINTGSTVVSFFEVVALAIARSTGDIFQILRDASVDRAEGDILKRIASDEGLQPLPARVAFDTVTVTDSSFQKISTKIYAGARAPNIGSTAILVSDASKFTSTGQIYVGRGTPNIEGPISYSSITQVGSYYSINLSSPTTKFHNLNESVVLAQGGVRNIAIGSSVQAPASGTSPNLVFNITQAASILDGEVSVSGVKVSAQQPGSAYNVPVGAIKSFVSSPFTGATVTNVNSFTTGRDTETDDQLRIRIKRSRLSKGLGTSLAVKNAVIGASPSDESVTVVSDEIVSTSSNTVTLFVDDGTGYEAKTQGVGLEHIVDSAIGGETHFQLETGGSQAPVAKAFLQTSLSAPFDIKGGDSLSIIVGGTASTHVFADTDFIAPGGATAYEVVASINSDTALTFQAATALSGTQVTVTAKAESKESLKTTTPPTGRDAASLLGFPTNLVETLKLYKNKVALSEDGSEANVLSTQQVLWSPTIASGDTLSVSVDGTAFISYTFLDSDFLAEGSYQTVSSTNSLESWANVINDKVTGVTASVVGEQLSLTSNRGASNKAKLEILNTCSLVSKGMFSIAQGLLSQGKQSDFSLSRNTAQFSLNTALVKGDSLYAGISESEGIVSSSAISGGTLTLPSDAHIWILADTQSASIINTGIVAGALITIASMGGNVIRITSNATNPFVNVVSGDYLILWSTEVLASNRIEARVKTATSSYIEVELTTAEAAAIIPQANVSYVNGFVILRSKNVPQKFTVTSGTKNINTIAQELSAQTTDFFFDILNDEIIRVHTETTLVSGDVLIVTADSVGISLTIPVNTRDSSKESLFAHYESPYSEGDMVEFIHGTSTSEQYADPIASQISSFNYSVNLGLQGTDPTGTVEYLQRYGQPTDALSVNEYSVLKNYSGQTITIEPNNKIKRIRSLDREYIASPLDLGPEETMIVNVDNSSDTSFDVPLFRKAATNSTFAINAYSFNAYDSDYGPTGAFGTSFPNGFDFSNFKVMMRAKNVIDPAGPQNAILYRSKLWGRSGEKVTVGYVYPTQPNSTISYTIQSGQTVDIRISLNSGVLVPNSSNATTEWNVTITPNTPVAGVDQVTYTYSGTGTAPSLTLSGGEYVTISSDTEFSLANKGTFKVSTQSGFTPTATSFTVQRATGSAVAEANKASLVPNGIIFFQSATTTAQSIANFVTTGFLSNFIEATLVNDSGTTGSGVVSKSTAEESNFAYSSVALKDGLNWIESSDITGSPQFTLKRPIQLITATGYNFNNAEDLRFVPTSMDQMVRFINELAVSGISTALNVTLSERSRKIEMSTNTIGSSGAIQIVGGLANNVTVSVDGTSTAIDENFTLVPVAASAVQSMHDGEWVVAQASNLQAKEIGLNDSSTVEILSANPVYGKSTIKLANKQDTDLYFGKPRFSVNTDGRTIKVEKQGIFTCLSWDGSGSSPMFTGPASFNVLSPGTLEVETSGTDTAIYRVLTGPMLFVDLSIGDFVTVSGMTHAANNGTFLVSGIDSTNKQLRVINTNAVNEYYTGSYTISNNVNVNLDTFTINGTALIAGTDFALGASIAETASNLSAKINTILNVTASATLGVVTVSSSLPSTTITLTYTASGGGGASVTAPSNTAYSGGTFSATIGVKEGDTVVVSAPFDVLNQGSFRVVKVFGQSIYIENPRSKYEEITVTPAQLPIGGSSSSGYKVLASNGIMTLKWNTVGNEPDFGISSPGNAVVIAAPFNALNQGTFVITESQSKLQEITRFTFPAATDLAPSSYFLLNSANDTTKYYAWFKIGGVGTNPALAGKVGIEVDVGSLDSSLQVATAFYAAILLNPDFVPTQSSNKVTVKTSGYADTTASSAGTIATPNFSVERLQSGTNTYLKAINPLAIAETSVTASTPIVVENPGLMFYPYDATVVGDAFAITSTLFGSANKGTWKVVKVNSETSIIVSGNMTSIEPTSTTGSESQVFVQEEFPYRGYKKINYVSLDTTNPTKGHVVLNGIDQLSKIDDLGGVTLTAVAKPNFPTTAVNGVDAYKFNTGLIAEANKIVYGDPRDDATYPGVAAAGAEIYIKEPLIRRVTVSIDVRLQTGIPFVQIVEQIRTNVSALIGANPIGQSISISSIVSSVNSIPGVQAVAISSPLYNAANDLITVNPSEKTLVIDSGTDISVSKIN